MITRNGLRWDMESMFERIGLCYYMRYELHRINVDCQAGGINCTFPEAGGNVMFGEVITDNPKVIEEINKLPNNFEVGKLENGTGKLVVR